MNKNVLEWLEQTTGRIPDKVCYMQQGKELTFSQVRKKAMSVGTRLADIEKGKPIVVMGDRDIDTIPAYLGVVYSGHTYAPVDGSIPKHRLDSIISMIDPSAILADSTFAELAEEYSDNYTVIGFDEAFAAEADEQKLLKIRRDMIVTDPLYIISTSGSTGNPKGVITSHQSLMCYIESYADVMKIDETDIFGNQSPLDYIAAIRDIYLPLYKGASTVVIPKEYFMEPNVLFEFLNKYKVNTVGWSVSALNLPVTMGAFEDVKLTTLKKICFSGSVMPIECLKVWRENLPEALFVNQYGPTEATASCTYYVLEKGTVYDSPLPIGVPYSNYRVFLMNADMTPTPKGEVGEICVSGPILALGYYNDPKRTAESFVQNPNSIGYSERMYKTGDYGRIREDGNLEFHGRMDRQVKVMGHRVELDEVEMHINKLDGVDECIILFEKSQEKLVLFYAGEALKKDIIIYCRDILPAFMIPRKIKKIDSLPKLANGKTDMNKLKEQM